MLCVHTSRHLLRKSATRIGETLARIFFWGRHCEPLQLTVALVALRDDFGSDGATRLLSKARREGDRRVMRFLGAEDKEALVRMEAAWRWMVQVEALDRQRLHQEQNNARERPKASL